MFVKPHCYKTVQRKKLVELVQKKLHRKERVNKVKLLLMFLYLMICEKFVGECEYFFPNG